MFSISHVAHNSTRSYVSAPTLVTPATVLAIIVCLQVGVSILLYRLIVHFL